MAGNIKGITIKFEGDTTDLGRSLAKIKADAGGVDKELRAVNKSLKFNPKNTELLEQKQKLLKDKIGQTKKELEAFKLAQQTLDDDPAVDKTSQQYMELRRNIIESESKLKHFNEELKQTQNAKFDQLGQKFQDVGGKMQDVGKGLTTHVTAPILAVGAASVKAFNEVQSGLNIVTQKTGATGEALKAMQDSARNLAKTIPTDFETAGAAVGEVNTRFGVTGKELEDLSAKFIKFAKVNGTDVNQSIDQVQKALSAFGLTAEDAPALLDAMTQAGQQTGVSMETLQSGLIQNAAALQELGLNIGQSTTFMAQLEKAGANSETVMQGLRKALKNAAADGKPLDQALSELQTTILNGSGSMDGLTASYDLFGKSGDQIYNAVKNGSLDFATLAQSAGNAAGVLDQTFQNTLTPAEQFQMTMNTVKDTGYELGSNLMEMLAPALQKISEGVQKVSEWWSGLNEVQQNTIIKVAAVVAAIGPLLIVIGKMSTGIGAIIKLLPMLASPAGIAIAAVAGLIAIGVALYKNWDKIKEKAGAVADWVVAKWTAFKEKVGAIWQGVKDAILAPIEKARDAIKSIIDKIRGIFKFNFELPKIKLPHFDLKPDGWKLSDLLHGEIPSLGIDWYAKGGIFKSPSLIGVGEAGAEAVLPIEKLNEMLANMADNIVNGVNTGLAMQGGSGDIVIPIYLYPSGAKMGEEIVKSYDIYKRQLG